jgi:hypothetical protein
VGNIRKWSNQVMIFFKRLFQCCLIGSLFFWGCAHTKKVNTQESVSLEPDKLYVVLGVDSMALSSCILKEPETGKSLSLPTRFTVRFILDESTQREHIKNSFLPYRPEYFFSQDDKQWIVQPLNKVAETIPLEEGSHQLRVVVEGMYGSPGLKDPFGTKKYPVSFESDPIEFTSVSGEFVVLRGVFASSSIEMDTGLGNAHIITGERNPTWNEIDYYLDGEIQLPEKDKLTTAVERAKWFLIQEGISFVVSLMSPGGGASVQQNMGNKDYQVHTLEMRFYQTDGGVLHLDPQKVIFPDQIENLRLPPDLWMMGSL